MHRESSVTRSTTGRHAQGLDSGNRQILADSVDAHDISTQVRHEDELARGVGKDLVRVRCLLAFGVGAWLFELEDLLVQQGKGGRVGGVPSAETRSGAGVQLV